jgi:hypothetical protein
MNKTLFKNYYWSKGKPIGESPLSEKSEGEGFRIFSDPYRKWLTIERYWDLQFQEVVYDSRWIDFRKLKLQEHRAWRKEIVEETPEQSAFWIRNEEDRVIFKEVCHFEHQECTSCSVYTPNHFLLCTHQLYYRKKGCKINGIVLQDRCQKIVFYRIYRDYQEGQFVDLLKEEWECRNSAPLNH